jgi:putative oxidoreductase
MNKWTADVAALMLRLTAGAIFLPHGFAKVFGQGGVAAFAADLPSYHLPMFLGYIAAYAELAGAVLLIAGLLTRIDALLLACTMFIAAFVVLLPDALHDAPTFFSIIKTIELPLSLLAINVAILFLGAGRFSLDHLVVWKRLFTSREKALSS